MRDDRTRKIIWARSFIMPKFIKNTDDIYYVWHFFQSTVGTLQIFVIALGVGIGILGVINLMEEKHQG